MKCTRTQDLFSSYLENAMEPPLRVAFEQHLSECSECKARYEKFNAAILMMEEMPELEVPMGFHSAVMSRVEQSRRTNPQPVKWWHMDWQRVFTVRVPAKALVMGLSALLFGMVVVQMTPNSITANFMVPSRSQAPVAGENDLDAPKPPAWHWDVNESSMSIGLDAESSKAEDAYTLQFTSKSSEAIKVDVFKMAAGGLENAKPSPLYSGYVESKQDTFIRVDAGTTVRVDWRQDGKAYREFVFIPSQVSKTAVEKALPILDTTIYGALTQISEVYGVVVIANGDLSKKVVLTENALLRPEDALYNAVKGAGFKCVGVAHSIFKVEPGV